MESMIILILSIGLLLYILNVMGVKVPKSKLPNWAKFNPATPWGLFGTQFLAWTTRNMWFKHLVIGMTQMLILSILFLLEFLIRLVEGIFKTAFKMVKKIMKIKL